MREILCRGQTRRRGEKVNMAGDKLPGRWVYGGVLQGPGDFSIIYGGENLGDIEKHTVYTDTIGQYIGLTDKNGVKIFEGDIVRGRFAHRNIIGQIVYGGDATFFIQRGGLYGIGLNNASDWVSVMGNIHDNPELIGGGQDG